MNLYAVFQEGVYRHDCVGVFDADRKAIDAADLTAANDRDSYHDYRVVPLVLNETGESTSIYEVNRKKARAKLGLTA